MDFAIGLFLFTFTLVIYFGYTNNFQKTDKGELDTLLADAKAVSSSLTLSGSPSGWDNKTVVRIGIADNQQVNTTKIRYLKNYDYTTSKGKFGTLFDYLVFFVNDKGEVLNINGVCVIGYPLVNASYNLRSAYYYQDSGTDFKLRDFMNQTLKADIYFKSGNQDIYGLYGLISNLSKYDFIMMEHPLMSGGDFSNNMPKIENFSSTGGLLMISGELATPSGSNMIGAVFNKKSGLSISQRTAIVNSTDPSLSLAVGQSMVFAQYYYVENDTSAVAPAVDFTRIATFNQTDDRAIAKWKYGNGTVYFFSDFDVSNFDGNFVQLIQDAVTSLAGKTCNPINLTKISAGKLVTTERYLNYDSKLVKMVIYLWQ